MHFGGTVIDYKGTPDGWVFEPMNVCVQPFFGADEQRNADWLKFGERIVNGPMPVNVTGVPRIWPEHLSGGNEDSNPNHALEIHPITKLDDNGTPRDFSTFVFAPEGLAGISEGTQSSILGTTAVKVKKSGNIVTITMTTQNLIGNFADIDVSVAPGTITALDGGHRMEGEALIEGGDTFPVRMVSVAGSEIDAKIEAARKKGDTKNIQLEVLALFSLSPVALLDAIKPGGRGKVTKPIQLILYGETDQGQ